MVKGLNLRRRTAGRNVVVSGVRHPHWSYPGHTVLPLRRPSPPSTTFGSSPVPVYLGGVEPRTSSVANVSQGLGMSSSTGGCQTVTQYQTTGIYIVFSGFTLGSHQRPSLVTRVGTVARGLVLGNSLVFSCSHRVVVVEKLLCFSYLREVQKIP